MRTRNHRSRIALTAAFLAVLAVAVTSCIDSDEPVIVEPTGGALFDRYVSLGNSVTAGLRSGGINVNTQREAYPVLLAEKAGAPFGIPGLALPGCPPLLVGPLTSVRTDTVACALRLYNAPDVVQNLAVPGAKTSDLTDPLGTGTTLNTLILGGRTQVAALRDADPSLVSVWIGNNDALGAALTGDTTELTSLSSFQASYDEIVAAINATDAQDAILIEVANPVRIAPALQPGAYFWAVAQNPPPGLPSVEVSDNCAPRTATGDPNPLGFRLISMLGLSTAIAAGQDPVVIDCLAGVTTGLPGAPDYLLDHAESTAIEARIDAFNAYIAEQASDNGWILVDLGGAVAAALADPDKVRKCQDLAMARDPASFLVALNNTCPVNLDATFFGTFFSVDGVHPSATAQAVMADTLARRLNEKHGLSLPVN